MIAPTTPKKLRKLSLKNKKQKNQLNKVSDEAEDMAQLVGHWPGVHKPQIAGMWWYRPIILALRR